MPDPQLVPKPRPVAAIENVAAAMIGIPLIAGGAVLLISTWRTSLATVGAMAAYFGFFLGAARLLAIPTSDMRPRRSHYLLGAASGIAAGVVFSLMSSSQLSMSSAALGAFYGAGWLWLGHFIREPFGATASPPYPPDPGRET